MGADTYFLLFDTKHKTRIVKGEVKDGRADVGDKEFNVDGTEPMLFRKDGLLPGSYSYYPFYIVKWDDDEPKTLQDVEDLEAIDIEQDEVTPDMQRKLVETELLKGLFRQTSGISGESKKKLMYGLIIAGIIGVVIYELWFLGYLPF